MRCMWMCTRHTWYSVWVNIPWIGFSEVSHMHVIKMTQCHLSFMSLSHALIIRLYFWDTLPCPGGIKGFGVRLKFRRCLSYMSFDGNLTSLNSKFFSGEASGGHRNKIMYCSEPHYQRKGLEKCLVRHLTGVDLGMSGLGLNHGSVVVTPVR